jgi:hypothetical protein
VKPLTSDPLADTYRKPLRFLLVGGSFALGYSLVMALLVGPVGLPAFATSVVLYVLCIPAAFSRATQIDLRQTGGAPRRVPRLCRDAGGKPRTRGVRHDTLRHTGLRVDTLLFLATAGAAALLSYFVSDRLAFRPEA